MTDPNLPSSHQSPKRRPVRIEDLTLLARVSGHPDAVRAFTDAERGEAEAYAAATGGTVEPLPIAVNDGGAHA